MTSADTKTREKLSVIKPGMWRNKYRAVVNMHLLNPDASIERVMAGEEYWGSGSWPSREVAEEVARKFDDDPGSDVGSGEAVYIGPYFFPADPDT